MARPPIIISNGGVIGELARDFDDEKAAAKQIKKNIKRLAKLDENEKTIKTVASWINTNNNTAPRILWHLKSEREGEENTKKLKEYLKTWDDMADLGREVR